MSRAGHRGNGVASPAAKWGSSRLRTSFAGNLLPGVGARFVC